MPGDTEGDSSPVSVRCQDRRFQSHEDGERQHHDIDWGFKVTLDGRKPIEQISVSEISDQIRADIQEAVSDGVVGMVEDMWVLPPGESEAQSQTDCDYTVETIKRTSWENEHKPFLREYSLSGALSIDTATPVTKDQGWLLAKSDLAGHVADKIASMILENERHRGKMN